MSVFDTFTALWDPACKAVERVYSLYGRRIFVGLFICLIPVAIMSYVRSQFSEEIVILTAGRGTSSWRSADRVAQELRGKARVAGVNFLARVEETTGAAEIRQRLQNDRNGNLVAYFCDEHQSPDADNDKLRALLPLDYDYLHILCRVNVIAGVLNTKSASRHPADFSYDFAEVHHLLGHGKSYAGPIGSESRNVYETLISEYLPHATDPELYLNPAIRDWIEARAALNRGDIDFIFFMAPYKTDTIKSIAHDGTSVLVGISSQIEELTNGDTNAFQAARFPRQAYTAAPIKLSANGHNDNPLIPAEVEFCAGEKIRTIASRRLLICSKAMKEQDAYTIAQAARSALQSDSVDIGDEKATPLLSTLASQPRRIAGHKGGLFETNKTPPSYFWNPTTWSWSYIYGFSFLTPFVLFLFEKVARRVLRQSEAPPRTVDEKSSLGSDKKLFFESTKRELEELLKNLELHQGQLTRSEFSERESSIRLLHEDIRANAADGNITSRQCEILFAGLRNIQVELYILFPDHVHDLNRNLIAEA